MDANPDLELQNRPRTIAESAHRWLSLGVTSVPAGYIPASARYDVGACTPVSSSTSGYGSDETRMEHGKGLPEECHCRASTAGRR